MNTLAADVLALFDDAPPLWCDEPPPFPELDDDELAELAGLAMASVMYEGTGLPVSPGINPDDTKRLEHLGDGGGAVSTTYDYEADIKPRLKELSHVISLDELRAFLGTFGAAKAPELKVEQFADVMAESGKLIERKAEQAAERDRLAAELEAERQAEEERLAAEAAERAAVAEAARAEQQRLEDERMRAAVAERAEKERLARAERDRLAAEKAKAEKARKDTERAAAAEKARLEKELLEQEQAEQARIADEAEQLRAKQTASGIAGLPFGLTKGQAKYRLRQILIGDARLSRTELAAGIALADLYDAQDQRRIYTWCSNENPAEWIGTTERNVIRATKRLGDLEYFTKESGWRGHSSRYFPNWDLLNKRVAGDTETEVRVTATVAKGDVHVTDRVTHMSPHTVQYRSHSVGIVEVTPAADAAGPGGPSAAAGAPGEKRTARNKRDGGSTSAGASAPEGFTEFWSVYPKQEGLLAAQSEYKRQLAKGVSPGLLLDAAKRYALAKADTDARWLKFPVTWLREQKYLENPQPPKPRAEKSAAPKREAKRKGKTTSKKKARAKIKGDTRVLGVAWHEDWGKVALLSRVTSSPVRVVTRHGVRRDTPAGLLSQFDMRAMRFDDVVRWLD